MPVVKVFGKVEPPWCHITFDVEPEVKCRIDEPDIDVTAKIKIHNSDIVVTVDLNRWDDTILGWILPYLFDWVSAEINLFSFSTGRIFDVHLDRAEDPGGTIHHLVSTAPDLAALATVCKTMAGGETVRVEMRDTLLLVVGSPNLMIALHDLISSVRHGNNSLTNCARAVEGLRKAMWGGREEAPGEREQAWEKLRSSLNISKPFLQAITEASRGPRHGSTSYIPSTVRQDVLRKSWQVMDRFLLYRTSGDTPLDPVQHPVL